MKVGSNDASKIHALGLELPVGHPDTATGDFHISRRTPGPQGRPHQVDGSGVQGDIEDLRILQHQRGNTKDGTGADHADAAQLADHHPQCAFDPDADAKRHRQRHAQAWTEGDQRKRERKGDEGLGIHGRRDVLSKSGYNGGFKTERGNQLIVGEKYQNKHGENQ